MRARRQPASAAQRGQHFGDDRLQRDRRRFQIVRLRREKCQKLVAAW